MADSGSPPPPSEDSLSISKNMLASPPPTTTAVAPKKNLGFAESFWTPDYSPGVNSLFAKLHQGVVESQQILAIARLRAEAEDQYGNRLAEISTTVERSQGFARDEGASIRQAYEGIKVEMMEAGKAHRKIAANVRELVVNPFGRWCGQHEARVNGSNDELSSRLKNYERQFESVKKLKSHYFNKCRLLEDAKEESQLGFQEPSESPKQPSGQSSIPEIREQEPEEEELYEFGDVAYDKDQVKKLIQHMMTTIPMTSVKFPILGTYQNVSTGANITEYIQKSLGASTVSYAERIGQSLIDNGFLRLVGQVGKTFANSSRINFKWQSKAFEMAGIMEKGKTNQSLLRSFSIRSDENPDSPIGAVGDYLSNWNPLNNQHPNETPTEKLRREVTEADQRYRAAVRKLDDIRCNLEEQMIDHLRWQEKLELERLSALKTVILDFTGAISNVIPAMQSTVDSMMVFQESIQPNADLRYMIETYRAGAFAPRVTTYENYTRHSDDQVFGIDVEARAKADGRKIPLVVTSILQHMDEAYPELEGDTARQAVWKIDVPLAATHHLRNVLNTRPITPATLSKYELPIVASVLKLYLLESESLIPSSYYDIIKAIYATESSQPESSNRRITILQSTLSQLKIVRIATLDAICTHFERFLNLTSADEDFTAAIANGLAACVLRPRVYTNLTFEDKHPYRLVRDLLAYRKPIFSELKRLASQTHTSAGSPISQFSNVKGNDLNNRIRSDSHDESGRKAAVEARNRAISLNAHKKDPAQGGASPALTSATTSSKDSDRTLVGGGTPSLTSTAPTATAANTGARSRASSPLPAGLGVKLGTTNHRRERSLGGEGRFPVIASPKSPPVASSSLASTISTAATMNGADIVNHLANTPVIGVVAPSPTDEEPPKVGEPDHPPRGRTGNPTDRNSQVLPTHGTNAPLDTEANEALQRRMGRVGMANVAGSGSKVAEIGRRFDSLPQNQKAEGKDGAGLVKGHSRGVTLEDKPYFDE